MKFLVLYMMPSAGLAEWMKLPEDERKGQEKKMQDEWGVWMQTHASALKETAGAGKTKRVTSVGVTDIANDIMLYSMVEAESQEAVATMFLGHPHLQIPESWIDIMPANHLPSMGS